MTQQHATDLKLWQFSLFKEFFHLNHFITDRYNGVSNGNYGSLNLSYASGDESFNVDANRSRLAQSIGIGVNQLYIPRQTHSNNVRVVDKNTDVSTLSETDALITNTPGICISVLVADCVPILLFDTVKKVIGVVHAGWRGTSSSIVVNTVQSMKDAFGSKPENILAGIGPSISPKVYEVGQEVIDAFSKKFNYADKLIQPSTNPGKYMLDLWLANQYQLMNAGIPESSIEIAGLCTFQDQRFFSARRMGVQCGRFAAGCMLLE